MNHKVLTESFFENLYCRYNRREFVHPDPLEFLYDYPRLQDREIVGLIASSLAYGRVRQILKSVSSVLKRFDGAPSDFIRTVSPQKIRRVYSDFKHRFTTGEELASMLLEVKRILKEDGSLYACFKKNYKKSNATIFPALSAFAGELTGGSYSSLVPSPGKGSACKKINLFLRWMVRNDKVDPGGWKTISPSALIIPLDIHMHRIALCLGLTSRKQANMKTAIEITNGFKKFAPNDPVRYDFTLTRFGIRDDMSDLFGS